MSGPVLLDLFGGVGGACRGYQQAGFTVRSVDIDPQPDTCADEFVQLDLAPDGEHAPLRLPASLLQDVVAVHASPPCQASSALTKGTNKGRTYPQLIWPTRAALLLTGLPFVIENVAGAPIRRDLMLCGEMFGLNVLRHRFFELHGFTTMKAHHPRHRGRVAGMRHGTWHEGPYFAVYGDGGGKGTVAQWRDAMGIDWTWNRKSIAEAIPPSYGEFIGRHLAAHLGQEAAA